MYYQWMMVHFLWHWLSFFDFSNTHVFRASAPCSQAAKERQQKLASDKFDTTLGLIFMKISIIIGATGVSIALHNAMAH
jgi:hypothetical protein